MLLFVHIQGKKCPRQGRQVVKNGQNLVQVVFELTPDGFEYLGETVVLPVGIVPRLDLQTVNCKVLDVTSSTNYPKLRKFQPRKKLVQL